ncbi:MAG: potassium-transporting ATPase subunit KdpC [Cyclobacteriaceae bacterium]|nr:potassium-transporting ATPase subunit KdpC [Cyclobacteriaceae bacterium]
MKTYLFPAIRLTFLTMILFGIFYPFFIVGVSKLIAPENGNGEIIVVNSKTVGFDLIGQLFTDDKYFNSRPSAVNYNAASSGGSNKGPSNREYLNLVQERLDDFLEKNPGLTKDEVPMDLITASASGLDPHISRNAALVQVSRIANARGLSKEVVHSLVDQYTQPPLFGLFGPSTVHVLRINIALDNIK